MCLGAWYRPLILDVTKVYLNHPIPVPDSIIFFFTIALADHIQVIHARVGVCDNNRMH